MGAARAPRTRGWTGVGLGAVSIDSTSVCAHQHAAGAATKRAMPGTNRTDTKHSDVLAQG